MAEQKKESGTLVHACNPSTRRVRQEDGEFWATLGYVRLLSQNKRAQELHPIPGMHFSMFKQVPSMLLTLETLTVSLRHPDVSRQKDITTGGRVATGQSTYM
jgi:hypothetical protein